MNLRFDPRLIRELPGESIEDPRSREVLAAVWSPVQPTPVPAPRLIAHSPELAAAIGFSPDDLASAQFVSVFSGNALVEGMRPFATRYGGHQFGVWAGQLGDGRAISLCEVIGQDGRRYELQLKGAGRTPYARHGDGRAVLRSSLREFVCSEAMHALGVPTTRALCLITTGETVIRDPLYDGRPIAEPGAIVCRVAPSFLRFGHYEILAANGEIALLERLIEFTLDRDFPELEGSPAERRARWFRKACILSAELVAHWMRIGFVHGVLNTDNMSVLGLSIDYGPFGFLETFDPEFTPNLTDAQSRRYAFGRQPAVVHWNLARLADALRSQIRENDLQDGLDQFAAHYQTMARTMTAAKFGLQSRRDGDEELIRDAYAVLYSSSIDHTSFFRRLAVIGHPVELAEFAHDPDQFRASLPALEAWWARYQSRIAGEDPTTRRASMNAVNPVYLPRNWLCQEAIEAAERGDMEPLHRLLLAIRDPYTERPGLEHYAERCPPAARGRPGCDLLSCSS